MKKDRRLLIPCADEAEARSVRELLAPVELARVDLGFYVGNRAWKVWNARPFEPTPWRHVHGPPPHLVRVASHRGHPFEVPSERFRHTA